MLLAIGKAADDDARQAVLALKAYQEILEAGEIEDQPAGLVRHEIAPILAAGAGEWSFYDLVVFRTAAIGEDNEPVFMSSA